MIFLQIKRESFIGLKREWKKKKKERKKTPPIEYHLKCFVLLLNLYGKLKSGSLQQSSSRNEAISPSLDSGWSLLLALVNRMWWNWASDIMCILSLGYRQLWSFHSWNAVVMWVSLSPMKRSYKGELRCLFKSPHSSS